MKNLMQIYSISLSLVMTVFLFASFHQKDPSTLRLAQGKPSSGSGKTEDITMTGVTTGALPQVITSIDLTKEYDFAGEAVPKNNFDALERLDRELSVNSYWEANTLINLKASVRYFSVIEPILARYGVPDDFKYMAVAESNLRNEVSPAGAKGIWQFLESTAEYYGLEISTEVDERYHLEKSTEAACKYLKEYYDQLGNWTLAAAAYNMGAPRLTKYLEEQKAQSYYDLNLNSETSRYVFRVIAMKEIMRNPVSYGFYLDTEDLYQPLRYNIVTVEEAVPSWGEFAVAHGTTYRMLKVFNPWLMTNSLTNKAMKKYEVKIPLKEG